MTDFDTIALVLVLVIVIEGIWLAGLTYLMWRRHLKTKRDEKAKEPPTQTG